MIRKHNLGRMSWPSNHVPPAHLPNFINLMSRRWECSRNKSEVQRANGRDFHESLHNLIDYLHVLHLFSVLFCFAHRVLFVCLRVAGFLFSLEPEKKVKSSNEAEVTRRWRKMLFVDVPLYSKYLRRSLFHSEAISSHCEWSTAAVFIKFLAQLNLYKKWTSCSTFQDKQWRHWQIAEFYPEISVVMASLPRFARNVNLTVQ